MECPTRTRTKVENNTQGPHKGCGMAVDNKGKGGNLKSELRSSA